MNKLACLFCGGQLKKNAIKYCSLSCHQQHKWILRKQAFEAIGFWSGVKSESSFKKIFKRN